MFGLFFARKIEHLGSTEDSPQYKADYCRGDKMKWMSLMAFLGLLALNCQNTGDATGDTGGEKTPVVDDLPQPALNTAEISLNGVRHTLTETTACRDGVGGITINMPGMQNPFLNIHNISFNVNGEVIIDTMSNPSSWNMDLDADRTWGTSAAGCRAIVGENSNAVFELKTIACNIKNQFGPETGKLSFRLRCTKGT